MSPIASELHFQFEAMLDMLCACVEKCPDALWGEGGPTAPYWREAYHVCFWTHNHLGPAGRRAHPAPFGAGIDPRLSTLPDTCCSRVQVLDWIDELRRLAAETLNTMDDDALLADDDYAGEEDEEFRSVLHRHLYALRHAQHHIGRMTVVLARNGITLNHWAG